MRQELKLGDEVWYILEDYDTGEDVIRKGFVEGWSDHHTLMLKGKKISLDKFYRISGCSISMQRNCLYTIQDLFDIARKAELDENNC